MTTNREEAMTTREHDEKAPDQIAAMIHRVGVSFGDHAETVVRVVEVGPDETVRDLMERLMSRGRFLRRDYDHFVTLRFVEPIVPTGADSGTEVPF